MTHPGAHTVDRAYRRRRTFSYLSRLGPKADLHRQVEPEGMRPPINSERTGQRGGVSVGGIAVGIRPSRPYGGATRLEVMDIGVTTTLPEPTYDRRWFDPVVQEVTDVNVPIRQSTTRDYPAGTQTPLHQYIAGIDEVRPPESAIRLAAHFVWLSTWRSTKTEIDFDDDDGSLLFDLRLPNGLLLMAELYSDGALYVGVHDDRSDGESRLVEWLENPGESEITDLFSEE